MFVDASAIVAILASEPEAPSLMAKLAAADDRLTSPIAMFEAIVALARIRRRDIPTVKETVDQFCAFSEIKIEPISEADSDGALNAYARFGKGRGHPAQLNMGDCFAYAMAQNRGIPLLYKGNDFSFTDVD